MDMVRDKLFVLLQACFGNLPLEEYSVRTEVTSISLTLYTIFQSAGRIAKGELVMSYAQY